ncbi:hypothetical protein GGTG_05605 [Gaeumannomyces tritici R3-111a-1]|uniref:CFEM domain-containing protein n=1 Tax=Gaeumannomyces tritici (strain R3-111a-1) TaxID=644352 RepID=J3NWE1_GAET3|nr:hypothetical protein GGTG_05605 [Gaeumannomyces tritici R3-111a-1]EJT75673.1 hypothetical protein GGTG_05605 [Gaeumannomyces tritici R3-111a-1]
MQFKTVLVALVAAVASAQDISKIPICAISCFLNNTSGTGCSSVFDFKCLCGNAPYFGRVQACATTACSAADQAKTLAWAKGTCSSVGVPLPE